ncbi:MAG: recombinase family protein [Clostridia bacterium]|nr:recombinase family protein [Clostridia bacterium]
MKFRHEQAGIPAASGSANWHEGTASRILQNSFYCGIIKYRKRFAQDCLEMKTSRKKSSRRS